MFDTHFSYIKVVGDFVFACKLSDAFTMLCRFDVFIWYKVVHNQCDFILMEHSVYFHFLYLMDSHR